MGKVVPANPAVLTWLKLARAEVNLVLAELSGVTPSAGADVAIDAVDASGVVLATVAFAIVHVHLAPRRTNRSPLHEVFHDRKITNGSPDTRIPLGALAGEPASFHDLTGGAVGARVSVAGVDDGVAVLAVETGCAGTLVVPVGQWPARRSVSTGVIVTKVTLGQDLRLNFTWKRL